MRRRTRPSWVRIALATVVVLILLVGGYGFYLAGEAGRLPWQEDPTRIPITPFADIPGFGVPTVAPTRVATPVAAVPPGATDVVARLPFPYRTG